MSSNRKTAPVSVIGIDIGKNSFHVVGQDQRGAIVLRQRWSRGQVEARLANIPLCLIGMEACVGAHHLSQKCDAEAIAEAVQRPTIKFVATKTAD
jgi:transposase